MEGSEVPTARAVQELVQARRQLRMALAEISVLKNNIAKQGHSELASELEHSPYPQKCGPDGSRPKSRTTAAIVDEYKGGGPYTDAILTSDRDLTEVRNTAT
jgi:hypothetical protein